MPRSKEPRSLVDEVHRALKDDICAGRLEPGQRIHLGDVCKRHSVSLSVVREAVTRLASERLVQSRRQQGFTVWPLSVEDLLDLTRVRVEIEAMALRDAIEHGDVAWEAELIAAHHRLAGTVRDPSAAGEGPNYAWMAAHRDFHAALVAACTSPLLRQLRAQLFDAAELYRHWSCSSTELAAKERRDLAGEHRELLDAAVGRDAERAVALLAGQIRCTTELLLAGRRAGVADAAG